MIAGDPLTLVDMLVAQWLHDHASSGLTQVMLVITNAHGTIAISAYALLVASYLAWKRDWYWLLCFSLAIPSGMIINVLTKLAIGRARPDFDLSILDLPNYSFPSGHVAGATLFYGVLAAMLAGRRDTWRGKALVVLGAFALVVLVAVTRMYLGVHYLSDTIAAFALSLAWLTVCLVGVDTYWRGRSQIGSAAARYPD